MGRTSSPKPYATLAPTIKHVSETAIRKKWRTLPPKSQDKLRQLILSLKAQSHASRNRKNPRSKNPKSALDKEDKEVEDKVDEVADRLLRRIPRMPFPPQSAKDEAQFDFEATLDKIKVLESTLTTTIQSMQLLRSQIAKEERALKRDKIELEGLKQGVKSSERLQKSRETNLHPIVKDMDVIEDRLIAGPASSRSHEASLVNLQGDERVEPLIRQLRSHLESMQNNTARMTPVIDELDTARDALDRHIYRSFDRQQYSLTYGLNEENQVPSVTGRSFPA